MFVLCLDTDGVPEDASARLSCSQPVRGKRKREEEEKDTAEKVAKKQRSSRKEPETITIPDDTPEPPRRGRGRQGRLRKQQQQEEKEEEREAESPKAEVTSTPAGSQKDDVIILDSPSAPEHTSTEGEWDSCRVHDPGSGLRILGQDFGINASVTCRVDERDGRWLVVLSIS